MSVRRRAGEGGRESPDRPSTVKAEPLDAAIAALSDCDAEQLRLQWRNHLGGAAPAQTPRWLLLRLLAYRMQAAAFGDLDKATLRALRQSRGEGASDARPFEIRRPSMRDGVGLKTGALLVREWNGRLERVMILEKGFAWNGATYRSLSQIAKAMTGTNWNGHRFFGLRPANGWRKGAQALDAPREHFRAARTNCSRRKLGRSRSSCRRRRSGPHRAFFRD